MTSSLNPTPCSIFHFPCLLIHCYVTILKSRKSWPYPLSHRLIVSHHIKIWLLPPPLQRNCPLNTHQSFAITSNLLVTFDSVIHSLPLKHYHLLATAIPHAPDFQLPLWTPCPSFPETPVFLGIVSDVDSCLSTHLSWAVSSTTLLISIITYANELWTCIGSCSGLQTVDLVSLQRCLPNTSSSTCPTQDGT